MLRMAAWHVACNVGGRKQHIWESPSLLVSCRPTSLVPARLQARVTLKIAGCTPGQLPPDMYSQLQTVLRRMDASVVAGYLRPGCCHLAIDVVVQRSASLSMQLGAQGAGDGIDPDGENVRELLQLSRAMGEAGLELARAALAGMQEAEARTVQVTASLAPRHRSSIWAGTLHGTVAPDKRQLPAICAVAPVSILHTHGLTNPVLAGPVSHEASLLVLSHIDIAAAVSAGQVWVGVQGGYCQVVSADQLRQGEGIAKAESAWTELPGLRGLWPHAAVWAVHIAGAAVRPGLGVLEYVPMSDPISLSTMGKVATQLVSKASACNWHPVLLLAEGQSAVAEEVNKLAR
jgi:hypothetical protein